MTDDDTSTLGSLAAIGESSWLAMMPALTILAHPDVHRVGEIAPLTAFLDGRQAKVDRDEPLFFLSDGETGRGLEHRGVSKKATSLIVAQRPDSGFELRPGESNYPVELDSRPFDQPRALTREDLDRGLIITINERIVLCLHLMRYPVSRTRDLGLLGASDAIEDVRR